MCALAELALSYLIPYPLSPIPYSLICVIIRKQKSNIICIYNKKAVSFFWAADFLCVGEIYV